MHQEENFFGERERERGREGGERKRERERERERGEREKRIVRTLIATYCAKKRRGKKRDQNFKQLTNNQNVRYTIL